MKLAMALFALAALAHAAGIDGRWSAETVPNGKKAAPKVTTFRLDLKSQDGVVTGTVTADSGKKGRAQTIRDGKIEGNRITFKTTQKSKKAENSFTWTATMDGDKLTGTRTRDGARRGLAFTARRAN